MTQTMVTPDVAGGHATALAVRASQGNSEGQCHMRKCYQNKPNKNQNMKYDVRKLHNPEIKMEYSNLQSKYYEETKTEAENEDPQTIWKNIAEASIKAAAEIAKPEISKKKCNDKETQELSKIQKELRNKAEASKDKEKRREIKSERNKILKQIHKKVEESETKRIDSEIENIDSISNDSNRMFRAKQFLQSLKPKQQLILQGNDGLTTNEEDCIEILTKHFTKVFNKKNTTEIPYIEAQPMKKPFKTEEVKEAVKSMKNNKSCGIDNIKAELMPSLKKL